MWINYDFYYRNPESKYLDLHLLTQITALQASIFLLCKHKAGKATEWKERILTHLQVLYSQRILWNTAPTSRAPDKEREKLQTNLNGNPTSDRI